MVLAELFCLPLEGACHRTGISGVGAVDEVRGDEDNIGRASGMRFFLVARRVLPLAHLRLDVDDLLLAGGSGEQLVHL